MSASERPRRANWADRPLEQTFPGAVHSRALCPACGLLWLAHRVARRRGRGHYLWSVRADGSVSVCTPEIPGVFPPPKR